MKSTTACMAALCAIPAAHTAAHAQDKPNIVVLMADDIGLGDIGFYHQQRTGQKPIVPTPNIDKLIRKGMRFSDAHTAASLSAPTRFSMLTGNYPHRNKGKEWGVWQPAMNAGIEPHYTTVARIAKAGGYTTAFFGKWGLGGVWHKWPKEYKDYQKTTQGAQYYGFDYSLELPQGIQNKPYVFYENGQWMKVHKDSKIGHIALKQTGYEPEETGRREGAGDSHWDPTQAGPILAHKAVDYINKQSKNTPFFLYYCSQAVHVPHAPAAMLNDTKIAGTTLGKHGDMIKELDAQVGMMIQALKQKGLYKNTLFIFTSDNGGLNHDEELLAAGHDSSNGLRDRKSYIHEGGHRVPFVAVWPGKIKPKTESTVPIVTLDVVATIATIAHQPIDRSKVIDSANLLPILQEGSTKPLHKYLVHQEMAKDCKYAIRERNLKLIMQGQGRKSLDNLQPIELFDLSTNLAEDSTKNLLGTPKHQAKVRELKTKCLELRLKGTATLY